MMLSVDSATIGVIASSISTLLAPVIAVFAANWWLQNKPKRNGA